ncbi:hypothetical protein DCCM_3916 [Desulfocucumis palustris]|uniref:DUF3298 domain-containing protein n=1 Tax=Desulfocucumis palustris TaxID=1898651 RepID=A0A2L2XKI3_9FIRM|nr:DUF3298 and DUF4163 domain-containing protein [Desulfocucumis palustris]GBF34796.1 hypothetical protein DCCM_3916 [Desulfocucumis palustris]
MSRKILFVLLMALLTATLMAGCGNEKTQPAAGMIKVETQKVQEKSEAIEVSLQIPVISGLRDTSLQTELNDTFAQKALELKKNLEAQAREDQKNQGELFHTYSVVTSFTVPYNKNGLLSINVEYGTYTGGAHGMTYRETLNIDTESGKKLQIGDFFKPDENYRMLVTQEIKKQIEANRDMYFPDALDTLKPIEQDQPFYIGGDDHIVVYYGLYEIAPFAAGMPEFKIPAAHPQAG